MLFGVVSGVGHGMGVLHRDPRAPLPKWEGAVSGVLFPHCFGSVNRHFQAKRAKYSNVHIMATSANYCMDSNQILRVSKDLQICRGWCSKVENKSKMAESHHLEKSKYRHVTVEV